MLPDHAKQKFRMYGVETQEQLKEFAVAQHIKVLGEIAKMKWIINTLNELKITINPEGAFYDTEDCQEDHKAADYEDCPTEYQEVPAEAGAAGEDQVC